MILLETRETPGIALLQLNRPEARNALSLDLRQALAERFRALAADDSVRAIVLTGGPKVFAAGADIKSMVEASPQEMIARGAHLVWQAISECDKPIIAAVNGYALGAGCELAMHADIIVAGAGAVFGQPEIKVGIMPGAGGTQRLTRLIGQARAMKLLLTGETISGRTAGDWGLVSEVTEDERVLPRALELAASIATMSAAVAQQIKELVRMGQDMPLSAALALERKSLWLMFGTADQREGMRAFLDKRPAQFNAQPGVASPGGENI